MENKIIFFSLVVIGIIALIFYLLSIPLFSITGKNTQDRKIGEFNGNIVEADITAKKWEFNPSVIEVNKGDKVVLNIKSIDVAHGMFIKEFGINEYLTPGKVVKVEFIADKKGEFNFFCNVFCGSGHGSMNGKLVIN